VTDGRDGRTLNIIKISMKAFVKNNGLKP